VYFLFALLALACRERYDVQRDETLKQTLARMRAAISAYKAEHGQHPASLEALVPQYLPEIPVDPITGAATWRLTTEETVEPSTDFTTGAPGPATSVVVEVHSAAPGADRSGVLYSNY
jgi:general secretion pathway protein G